MSEQETAATEEPALTLEALVRSRIEMWEQRAEGLDASAIQNLWVLATHYRDRADELRHDLALLAVSDVV